MRKQRPIIGEGLLLRLLLQAQLLTWKYDNIVFFLVGWRAMHLVLCVCREFGSYPAPLFRTAAGKNERQAGVTCYRTRVLSPVRCKIFGIIHNVTPLVG